MPDIFSSLPASVLSLAYLAVLLIAAKIGEEGFRKLGLIPFVGAIFVGTLIGPGVFNVIAPVPTISLFVGLGINFLLFLSGAQEFEASRLKSMLKSKRTMPVGVLQFSIRFIGIATLSFFLFHEMIPAIVIGIVAGMSSAGPLSRLLTDTGLARTDEGTAIFSQVAIIEIAAVILFSFVYDLAGRAITLVSVATIGSEIAITIVGIILFGRYVMVPLLESVEKHFHGREVVFAITIALVLLAGFVGEVTGFNSAIVALFLGLLLQKFFSARPVLVEKLNAFTYGFFEPLFFAGLGLYFVKVTPGLIALGLAIFGLALALDASIGAATAKLFKVSIWKNAFGICVNGGVDAALLVSALTASAALIGGYIYSAAAIGIALLSLTAPLLFRLRAPLVVIDQESGTRKIVKQQLESLIAEEISKTLPTVSVLDTDTVQVAVLRCINQDARATVVVNKDQEPVGTMILRDTMTLTAREMRKLKVTEGPLAEAAIVEGTEPALRLAEIFKTTNIPIVAVVNKQGKLVGTILEREILRRMVESLEDGPGPQTKT